MKRLYRYIAILLLMVGTGAGPVPFNPQIRTVVSGGGGGITISSVNSGVAFKKGDSVTIAGSGFGASQGAGSVAIQGVDPITKVAYGYIARRSVSTVSTVVASGNITLNAPSGGAQNDIYIAVIACRGNATVTAPTGGEWTQIVQEASGNTTATAAGGIASGSMWWCRRGASNPNFVFQRTGGDVGLGYIVAYRGCKTSGSPLNGTATSTTLGSVSTTATTGGITTTVPWCRVVMGFAGGDNGAVKDWIGATDPYLLVERGEQSTTTGADTTVSVADAWKALAGATGTLQATSAANSRHVMMACALEPAAFGPETQTVTAWSDTSITITAVRSSMDIGAATLTVINNSAQSDTEAVTLKGLEYYMDTASSAGGDGTVFTTSGANRAFHTLDDALESLPASTTDQVTIYCAATGAHAADTVTAITTDTTTTAPNYILVKPYPGQEHGGKWNANVYRMEVVEDNGLYNNAPSHFIIDGIQAKVTATAGNWTCFKSPNAGQTAIDVYGVVRNCIGWGVNSGGTVYVFSNREPTSPGDGVSLVYNNIAIGGEYSFQNSFPGAYFYNNTGYGATYGFVSDQVDGITDRYGMVARNNIVSAASIDFVGTFPNADYNSSTLTGATGSNSRNGAAFTFVNTAAMPATDLHLQTSDGDAKNFGQDLSSFGFFLTDIDGQTRSGTWDIGADEYQ